MSLLSFVLRWQNESERQIKPSFHLFLRKLSINWHRCLPPWIVMTGVKVACWTPPAFHHWLEMLCHCKKTAMSLWVKGQSTDPTCWAYWVKHSHKRSVYTVYSKPDSNTSLFSYFLKYKKVYNRKSISIKITFIVWNKSLQCIIFTFFIHGFCDLNRGMFDLKSNCTAVTWKAVLGISPSPSKNVNAPPNVKRASILEGDI